MNRLLYNWVVDPFDESYSLLIMLSCHWSYVLGAIL